MVLVPVEMKPVGIGDTGGNSLLFTVVRNDLAEREWLTAWGRKQIIEYVL